MTIPATEAIGGPYTGDGVQVDFTFPFKIIEDTDVDVFINDGTTGATISSSLYSVEIDDVGGTVTLGTALTDGYKLAVIRNVTFEQATNLTSGQAFFAEAIETMDDYLTMQTQYLNQIFSQTFTFDPTITSSATLYAQLIAAVAAASDSVTEAAEYVTEAETAQTAAEQAETNAELAQTAAELAEAGALAAEAGSEAAAIATIEYGGVISNGSDTEHDIDITAFNLVDSTKTVMLTGSAMTKQIDAQWATGTDAGGLADGVSLAPDTWYHLFTLGANGVDGEFGWDTSLTATNLMADSNVIAAGLTHYRRKLGHSILTDSSSNIIQFTKQGNKTTFDDIQMNFAQGTWTLIPALNTVTVPLGIPCIANVIVGIDAPGTLKYYAPGAGTTQAPILPGSTSGSIGNFFSDNGYNHQGELSIPTNSSSQILIGSDADTTNSSNNLSTLGWVEYEL